MARCGSDFSGYYKTYVAVNPFTDQNVSVNFHDYAFMGGPRVKIGPAFFHALFGGDVLTGSAVGSSLSQTDFASAFGGGVRSRVFSGHWAVRISADYVLSHHALLRLFEPTAPALTQNNLRVAGGIVYVFGPSPRK